MIPARTRLFWTAFTLISGPSLFQAPADQIRSASDTLARRTRLPGSFLITGRPPRRVRIADATAELPGRVPVPVRVYRPGDTHRPLPVVVSFHGGGFVSGDPHQSQWWCASIADAVPAVVVSADYRLAPEHPYPAAVEDAYTVTCWATEQVTDLGGDPGLLAVMGDSAGGNLAAAVALMARDHAGPAIRLQVLLYPILDLSREFPSHDRYAHAPVLGKADLRVTRLYCPAARTEEPYASPLRATTHAGLPPALIQAAGHDPLRDHATAYAEALRAAGVPVQHITYPDAIHGYTSIPGAVPTAARALRDTARSLREHLSRHAVPD